MATGEKSSTKAPFDTLRYSGSIASVFGLRSSDFEKCSLRLLRAQGAALRSPVFGLRSSDF